MRNLILIPAFALGLSCTSHASQRRYSNDYRYRSGNLAYELEQATWSLRRTTEYADRYRSRYDKRTRKEIRKLHQRAQKFRRTVERRRWEDRRTHNSLDQLTRQYYRTEDALRHGYGSRRLYRSFRRVQHLMIRIQSRSGVYAYRRHDTYRH